MASQDGQKSEFFKIRNSSLNIKKINFEYKNVFENEFLILQNDILIHVQYKKIRF